MSNPGLINGHLLSFTHLAIYVGAIILKSVNSKVLSELSSLHLNFWFS